MYQSEGDRALVELTIITGGQRARLLRALAEPRAMGDLAAELGVAPSSATHHVRALEAAGLVVRRRDGSMILVTRTARGAALIMLCDRGPRAVGQRTHVGFGGQSAAALAARLRAVGPPAAAFAPRLGAR